MTDAVSSAAPARRRGGADCVLVLLVASSWARAGESEAESIMHGFSRSFKAMESAVDRGDAQALVGGARDLETVSRKIARIEPQTDREHREEFHRHGDVMSSLAGEIRELAATGQLDVARLAVEDVRRGCVSCHARFRRDNDEAGFYPAKDNTVVGRVNVLDLDGREKPDRSNAVVFVDGIGSSRDHPLPRRNPVISQKNRLYHPRVLPVLKGTTVDFPNDDTIFHNVFSLSKAQPFDLGIYKPGGSRSVTFERLGLVKVYCNIHPDMITSIIVLNNPYYAVTDDSGFYVITGVPDGEARVRVWNEFGGETAEDMELDGGELHLRDLTIKETRRSLKHKNKFGKSYRGKY